MNLGLVKSGIQIISGIGVGYIVEEAIKIVKPKNLVGLKKIAVKVGGYTLAAMAADKAADYVEERWDKAVEEIRDFVRPPIVVTEEEPEAE